MSSVNTVTTKSENKAQVSLTLEVTNIDQLSRVLAMIEQLPNVIEVRRHR